MATLEKIRTRSSIAEEHLNASDEEMLKDLIQAQKIIIATLYTGLKAAQKEGDEGTMDMIVSRITLHEKNKWMLQSSL